MFTIGGKRLSELRAALVCEEADRLHVAPGKVASVTVPRDMPEFVNVAGQSLTVFSAASLAEEADRLGVTPGKALVRVLENYARRDSKRARTRGTRRMPGGSWDIRRAAPCH